MTKPFHAYICPRKIKACVQHKAFDSNVHSSACYPVIRNQKWFASQGIFGESGDILTVTTSGAIAI